MLLHYKMSSFTPRLVTLLLLLTSMNVNAQVRQLKPDGKCTTSINPLKNVCYWYEATPRDNPSALQFCESQGGTLAGLDTPGTAAFVKAWLSDRPGEVPVTYIGYSTDYSRWDDGSVFGWTNWCHGQPTGGSEACVNIKNEVNDCWNDVPCGYKYPSICQKTVSQTRTVAHQQDAQVGARFAPRSEKTAETVLRCARLCVRDPLCGKFNYHPTTRLCALYVEEAVVDEADGSQTFTF